LQRHLTKPLKYRKPSIDMKKQRERERLFSMLFVSFLIGLMIGLYFYEPVIEELVKSGVLLPELSTLGYEAASVDVEENTLYLSAGCYQLSMLISDDQALSISRGMANLVTRPLTHDIFAEIADNFGLELLIVKIDSFEDNTYRARIVVKQGSRILDIDSRPSDAVALAVRMKKQVYVKEDLLKEYGVETC
jgi:bifunctional DNase/RNase